MDKPVSFEDDAASVLVGVPEVGVELGKGLLEFGVELGKGLLELGVLDSAVDVVVTRSAARNLSWTLYAFRPPPEKHVEMIVPEESLSVILYSEEHAEVHPKVYSQGHPEVKSLFWQEYSVGQQVTMVAVSSPTT